MPMQLSKAIYFSQEDISEINTNLSKSLQSGQLTLGPFGSLFEKEFCKLVHTQYGVAVNSGTSSLEILLRILDVKDKEVIVPTDTFFATPAAVIHAGGIVRFADVDRNTFSLSLETIKKQLNKNTVAVIIVHIAGIISPEINKIVDFCKKNKLFLIEDAAHAHGSHLNGIYAGNFGNAASFSFYPTKVITSAEGGIIVTNDKKIYDESIMYRDQGKIDFKRNYCVRMGYNWRMSEPHAIIGLTQLKHINEYIKNRQMIAQIYNEGISHIPELEKLILPKGSKPNFYKYIAILKPTISRDQLKNFLREQFKFSLPGEVYELPCHLQPIFAPYNKEPLPEAEYICKQHICLPISGVMKAEEAYFVIDSLKVALKAISL